MSTYAAVTRVRSDCADNESWTMEVSRFPVGVRVFGAGNPNAADIPQDIRECLRAWLDGAEAVDHG